MIMSNKNETTRTLITQHIRQKEYLHHSSNGTPDHSLNLEATIDPSGGGIYIQCCSLPPSSQRRTNNNNSSECSSKCDSEEKEDNNKSIVGDVLLEEAYPVIERGHLILSCPALSIALDPSQRRKRCGYCATKLVDEHDNEETKCHTIASYSNTHKGQTRQKEKTSFHCQHCHLISICEKCQQNSVHKWHEESGECVVLSCLVYAWDAMQQCTYVENDGQSSNTNCDKDRDLEPGATTNSAVNKSIIITEEMANQVNSLHLLTTRVLIRQWFDTTSTHTHNVKKPLGGKKGLSSNTITSPFPNVAWELFDYLYSARETSTTNELVKELCRLMDKRWTSFHNDDHNKTSPLTTASSTAFNGKESTCLIKEKEFESVMNKIIGCSHAITDVHEPLGCQSVGRALFLQHSFYNHCCIPNAFISCLITTPAEKGCNHHNCLIGRLHCINDIHANDAVTISYIPTSGLDCKERRQKLCEHYDFHCNCKACKYSNDYHHPMGKLENQLCVPADSDVEIIRQMQYICNQQLLEIERRLKSIKNEANIDIDNEEEQTKIDLQNCISTIQMNQRGIQNQSIPGCHEVSIESHRLLAFAMSLQKDFEEAIKHYNLFIDGVMGIKDIYDPVTWATCLTDFANVLNESSKAQQSERFEKVSQAYDLARTALGDDHSFVQMISRRLVCFSPKLRPVEKRKKRKII